MNRNQWIDQAKQKLDSWNSTVGELETRAAAMKERAKADYLETLGEAKEHLGHAKHQVEKVGEVRSDAWEDVKQKVVESWEKEKKAFENAVAALRS